MRIVTSESENPTMKEAFLRHPDITLVSATNLNNACTKLISNQADAMVAGIDYTTRDVALTCKKNLKVTGNFFSSCFVMTKKQPHAYFGRCGNL